MNKQTARAIERLLSMGAAILAFVTFVVWLGVTVVRAVGLYTLPNPGWFFEIVVVIFLSCVTILVAIVPYRAVQDY